jgi:hypothetical protein
VSPTFSTAAAPTPAGGAFAAGTYDLVSEIFYGPAGTDFFPGQPFRQTYVLSDVTSTSFTLDLIETVGTIVARSHETAALSGMTATFSQTCPDPDGGFDWSESDTFTATSSSITLLRSLNGATGVVVVRVYNNSRVP